MKFHPTDYGLRTTDYLMFPLCKEFANNLLHYQAFLFLLIILKNHEKDNHSTGSSVRINSSF